MTEVGQSFCECCGRSLNRASLYDLSVGSRAAEFNEEIMLCESCYDSKAQVVHRIIRDALNYELISRETIEPVSEETRTRVVEAADMTPLKTMEEHQR